eukprot:4757036-Alexandrium_andersonii.AAC.1
MGGADGAALLAVPARPQTPPLQERDAERRKAGRGRPTAEGRSSQRRRQTAGATSAATPGCS